MEILNTVLSVASIVIVIVGIFIEFKLNKYLSAKNEEVSYYKDLYKKYLMDDIPAAMKATKESILNKFENKKQAYIDFDLVVDVIEDMLNASFFAKYEDTEFFKNLNSCANKIIDYCMDASSAELNSDEAMKYYLKLDAQIASLYSIIIQKNILFG